MAEQFYTILTQIGKAKIANASALGNKVNFTHFALGDGDGSYYNPVESQTELKNEVWRGQIESVTVDEGNPNWLVIETIIPANIGGFMIREAGVFDEEGNLLAIGKYPETYKPAVEYGSAKDLYVRMILEVANTSVVNLKVDPTVILATKKDIDILTNRIAKNEIDISTLQKEVSEHKAKKATQTTLGHVKAGKNVTIQIDGTLDVDVDTMIKFNRNPTSDDVDYDTGQLWFNTDTGNIYVLFKIDKDGSAIWRGVNNTELIYPLKIYGVRIDMNNSNPLTSVVYTDDAVNMTPAPAGGGISEWDNVYPYSEIKPCLLKAGEVQTYLNPNNLAQKADGTPADITTGDNGDVMVEFPVIYWKIWREGQYLYVKYANYKIDSTWKALAHTKRSTLKDNIYIGAFLGYELSGKLRSLSGKTVTANKTIGDFRPLAQANGGGYSQIPYFAVLMLQILYLVKYKSRDSQTALGRGFVDGNSAGIATGGTITKGIDFGETTGKQQMKFLNIEDFWGNYYYWLDGLVTDSSYNLLYSNDNFNDSGTGYEKFTTGISSYVSGYIDDVWGNTETGFIIKSKNGSDTTHFCDFGILDSGMVPYFGGNWRNDSDAGFAQLRLSYSASYAASHIAARLFYA